MIPGTLRLRSGLRLCWIGVAAISAAAVAVSSAGGGAGTPHDFEATNGAHVTVSALPGVDLRPVTRLPGISASSGPFPTVTTGVRHGGRQADLMLEVRPTRETAVDRPLLASGTWARSGAVVLERGIARELQARPGDRIKVSSARGAASLRVAGTAVTTSESQAIGYVTARTLARVAPNARTYGAALYLRVAEPARSSRYVDWIRRSYPEPQATVADWHRLETRAGASPSLISAALVAALAAAALLSLARFPRRPHHGPSRTGNVFS
jgi:putative ABC transport system permease protein